jgi:REP element-mobilizing transposase RayT
MANSFSRIYIHFIITVKHRKALIPEPFETELYHFICGIANNLNQNIVQINGMPDHIHILARLRPTIAPSVFMQKIKANSSRWINESKFLSQQFQWQRGSGMFSVDEKRVDVIINYIKNQKTHHLSKSHKAEYLELLEAYNIEFDPQYLPTFFD